MEHRHSYTEAAAAVACNLSEEVATACIVRLVGAAGDRQGEEESSIGCLVVTVVVRSRHIRRQWAETRNPEGAGSVRSCSASGSGRSSRTRETP